MKKKEFNVDMDIGEYISIQKRLEAEREGMPNKIVVWVSFLVVCSFIIIVVAAIVGAFNDKSVSYHNRTYDNVEYIHKHTGIDRSDIRDALNALKVNGIKLIK